MHKTIPKFAKKVPTTTWSSPDPMSTKPKLNTMIILIIGLWIFGTGDAVIIAAGLGVAPWTVLAQGIGVQFDYTIGQATFLISVAVLFLWIPLKEKPGIGTFINFFVVAAVIEITLPYIPNQTENLLKLVQVFVAILVIGLGGSIYLIANLGPGPRDGLMTGISKKTRIPMAYVRNLLEISVVISNK